MYVLGGSSSCEVLVCFITNLCQACFLSASKISSEMRVTDSMLNSEGQQFTVCVDVCVLVDSSHLANNHGLARGNNILRT